MNYQNLTVNRRGNIAVVILNRPDRLNALSLDLMLDIERLAEEFRNDSETRAIVFAGAGKHFCAGADLQEAAARRADNPSISQQRGIYRLGPRMIRGLVELDQITICAIQGGALGGGAVIASALDFRIGAEDCFVSYPEIHLGMNLSWGGLPLCVRLVGPAKAKRMIILGEREPAGRLHHWGFLDEIVPADKLLAHAVEMAELYASRPPIQVQMIKRSINVVSGALDSAIMHMETDQFTLAAQTRDSQEGIAAFLQKRPPNFKGA